MRNPLAKDYVMSCPLDRKRRPTISTPIVGIDKGCVMTNNNGLVCHPSRTDLVRAISYVTSPLSINQNMTFCPDKIDKITYI